MSNHNKAAPRAPKSGGGILPYKRENGGQVLVLLAREYRKGTSPKYAPWGEFGARVSNPKESDRIQAALTGFEEETGISPHTLEISGKPLIELIHEEGNVHFSSDVDNYSVFPVDVSAENSKGFPSVTQLKQDRHDRKMAYKKAKFNGDHSDATRLRKTINKDDFRWVPLEVLKKLAAFDTNYYDDNVRATSEWSGETFTFSKDLLNLLKENNTWGT